MHYSVDKFGKDTTTVEIKDGKKIIEKPWQEYLRDHVDEKLHAMMKRNVLLATRNFQHRVETFRKEVIFGQNNPLKVRHISYRVEFQGRGAAHVHGVLWLDLDEIKVEGVTNTTLKESYNKLKHSQPLEAYEVRALEKFTDTFVTCTRCVTVAGAEAVKIAEETNWHGHSSSCKKGSSGRLCRWKFPRYPLARTIFVDANREIGEEKRMEAKVRDEILDRVMRVLVQEEGGKMVLSKRVKRIMLSYPNVRRINEEEASEEDEVSSSEDEEVLQTSISAEQQTFQSSSEDPMRHRISAEQQHPEQTISEGSQDRISAEQPNLQHSPPEASNSQEFEDPPTPSPSDYYPDYILPLVGKRISAERPIQQSSTPQPSHLNRKKTAQPPSKETQPPSKKAKKPNRVTYVKMESPEEYKQNIRERIDKVLKKASAGGEPITYEMYEKAVIDQPRKGSEVLLQRDIDEIFINNYNSVGLVFFSKSWGDSFTSLRSGSSTGTPTLTFHRSMTTMAPSPTLPTTSPRQAPI